jgi:hypothetical protein
MSGRGIETPWIIDQPEGWGMGFEHDAPAFRLGSKKNALLVGASVGVPFGKLRACFVDGSG